MRITTLPPPTATRGTPVRRRCGGRAPLPAAAPSSFPARQLHEQTSVAQIGAAVGVSAASVFYYFTDKLGLLRALAARDCAWVAAVLARQREGGDPVEALLAVVAGLGERATIPDAGR